MRDSNGAGAIDGWRSIMAAEDLSHLIPLVESKTRDVLMLRKTPLTATLGKSRIGGPPDLPEDFAWPESEGVPWEFLAQIDLAEAARAWPGSPLPKSGHLWFFIDANHGVVLHDAQSRPLRPCADQSGMRGFDLEFAHFEDIPELDLEDRLDIDGYLGLRAHYDGHKLLGFANAIQSGEDLDASSYVDPEAPVLLFQMVADEEVGFMWGDGGSVYFLIDPADLASGQLHRARFEAECF